MKYIFIANTNKYNYSFSKNGANVTVKALFPNYALGTALSVAYTTPSTMADKLYRINKTTSEVERADVYILEGDVSSAENIYVSGWQKVE